MTQENAEAIFNRRPEQSLSPNPRLAIPVELSSSPKPGSARPRQGKKARSGDLCARGLECAASRAHAGLGLRLGLRRGIEVTGSLEFGVYAFGLGFRDILGLGLQNYEAHLVSR